MLLEMIHLDYLFILFNKEEDELFESNHHQLILGLFTLVLFR